MTEPFNFNVLTDPWVPLLRDGGMHRVSLVALLTDPDCDAEEMGHPREDFGFLARVLASGIVQALWPAPDREALEDRIDQPMTREEVDPVVVRFREGFNLLGDRAFMQPVGSKGDPSSNDTTKLMLDVSSSSRPKLLRHDREYEGLCPACMTLALFGAQFLATGTGSTPAKNLIDGQLPAGIKSRIGYESGIRGPSSLITLVHHLSVRGAVWKNTLVGLPQDRDSTPWSGVVLDWKSAYLQPRRRDSIPVVEGIFWQPRAVECRELSVGLCDACGDRGPLIAAYGYSIGLANGLKDGFFRDPWLPIWHVKSLPRAQETPTKQPVWTGLADMLSMVGGTADTMHRDRVPEAAPVVQQHLGWGSGNISLLVFGQSTNNASLVARFAETLSLSMRTGDDGQELLSYLRGRVQQAEKCLQALHDFLKKAWSPEKKSKASYWPHDAAANFWLQTEGPFLDEKRLLESDASDPAASVWTQHLRRISLAIFDALTEGAAIDPVRAHRVAHARRGLRSALNKLLSLQDNPKKVKADDTSSPSPD